MGYPEPMKLLIKMIIVFSMSSCSLFGIQSEEGPRYKVLHKKGDFEIRRYESYIVAKATVQGNYDDASEVAFKRLAGYIFGENRSDKKLSMTSPVKVEKSLKIPMTSPVKLTKESGSYTMSFFMPSQYKKSELPTPLNDKVKLEEVESKTIASHRYTWLSSKERNDKKAKELREWLKKLNMYEAQEGYTYAGYNPPWTIPFLRRNEVHIRVKQLRR